MMIEDNELWAWEIEAKKLAAMPFHYAPPPWYIARVVELISEIRFLMKEKERLKEALDFYADETNYKSRFWKKSNVIKDRGCMARNHSLQKS